MTPILLIPELILLGIVGYCAYKVFKTADRAIDLLGDEDKNERD